MFFSFLQQPSSGTWLVVQVAAQSARACQGARDAACTASTRDCPSVIKTWNQELSSALFAARVATVALGVLGLLGAMLADHRNLRHGLLYRQQAPARTRHSHGAGGAVNGSARGRRWDAPSSCSRRARVAGMVLGILATKVLSYIVYQAAPNDPVVLGGVVLTMLSLGLLAAWIPAQKALAVDPMILMREE